MIWGSSFMWIELALIELPPLPLTTSRVALAAVALLVVLRLRGYQLPGALSDWRDLLIQGFLSNALPFALFVWSQQYITAGLASIFNGTAPIWTVLLAHVLTSDERLTRSKLLGVIVGFAGLVAIVGVNAVSSVGQHWQAQFAAAAAPVSYAFGILFARRFTRMPTIVLTTGQLITASLMLIVATLVFHRGPVPLPTLTLTWVSVLTLSLVSTAFALLIYFKLVKEVGATRTILVTFLIPPSAIVLGVLVLGETLRVNEILGFLAILAGLFLVVRKRTPAPDSVAK